MEEGETGEEGEWDEVQDVGEKESRDTREGSEGKGGTAGSVMQYCIIFCLHNSAVFPPQHKVLYKTLWLCPGSLGCVGIVPCGGISDPSYMHIMIQGQLYMYMITHQRLIKQSKATQLHVHQLRRSLSLPFKQKVSCPRWDSNPHHCFSRPVLYPLRY